MRPLSPFSMYKVSTNHLLSDALHVHARVRTHTHTHKHTFRQFKVGIKVYLMLCWKQLPRTCGKEEITPVTLSKLCVCVRVCVHACVRVYVRVCVRACVWCACVCVRVWRVRLKKIISALHIGVQMLLYSCSMSQASCISDRAGRRFLTQFWWLAKFISELLSCLQVEVPAILSQDVYSKYHTPPPSN